jgi:hypothetical protein
MANTIGYGQAAVNNTNGFGKAPTNNTIDFGEVCADSWSPETNLVGASGAALLLDTYSGAKAAYSLRKLSSTYSGSAIRVRRSSDNTEQDIGFTSDVLDTTSLLSFVGSNNGYITTWYDQSGNGINAVQSTATNQPSIILFGVLYEVDSKPAINAYPKALLTAGTASDFKYLHDGTTRSFTSNVYQTGALTAALNFIWLTGDSGASSIGAGLFYSANNQYQRIWNGTQAQRISNIFTELPNTHQIQSQIFDASNATSSDKIIVKINNGSDIANNTTAFTPNSANSTEPLHLFNYSSPNNSYGFNGLMQEMVFWDSDQDANISGINTNTNNFYSIY